MAGEFGISSNGRPNNRKSSSLPSEKHIAETYAYVDEGGKYLFEVVRFEPPGEEKTFRQGRRDGNGKWKWGTKGIRRVLYKLPEIKSEEDLFYVEGEKDVEGIFSLGLCATTNPGGAGKLAKLQAEHRILNPLKGKSVFILPDNDEAGRKHAEQAAELLYKIAKEARIVPLPGLSDKGDVSDFIEKEGDKARGKLIELAVSAPVWKPPSNFLSAEDLLTTKYEHKTPIIARGIMPDNSHIIVSGETGVGKSLLRQELALHLAMGWEWLDFEIPTARKVAVFQYENSDQMEQTRLKRMCHGLGIERLPKGGLTYINRKNRINLTLKKDREKLLNLVEESQAQVIIYDCLSNLHSSKENDNIQMRDVLDSLSEINAILGTSCIVIHHFGKPGEHVQASAYRTRGASSILDWAVTAMAFTVKPHESRILRLLEFNKVRDGAVPKSLLLERDENFILHITEEDVLCSPTRVREILEDLGGSVEKQSELVSALLSGTGCGNRSARTAIKKALERKLIQATDSGPGRAKGYYVEND